jgi:eukaryotic-like serine/threonine-protein kinase
MLQAGDKVGRFIVEHVLGQGGMGIVYQAHDENLGRKIALKVVSTTGDAEASARVLREARVIAALDHPNAVIIHEGGEINGEPYIAMELVPGQNLRAFVDKPDVPPARKIRWLLDVARVLAAAHGAGIVHRDVKPENVMVRPDGKVKVLDFGIARRSAAPVDAAGPTAKAFIPTVTSSGGFVGTPMYMAPELLKGKAADGRSDQFSWAVLAYELLEGKAPWEAADALGIVATMMSEPPKPMQNAAVPEEVRTVIMRALSASPAARYGSMDDIVELLQPHAEKESKSESAKKPAIVTKTPVPVKKAGSITAGRYSTQDLGQAIALALERKAKADATGGKYDFNDLKAAASEVGIEEDDLREALASLQPALPPVPDRWVDRRRRAKQKLQRHAAIWASFSVFFFLLDMVTAGGEWFFFPVLGWGVGLAVQAVRYYFPVDLTPEEEAIEQQKEQLRHRITMEKLAKKQGKRVEPKLRVAELPEKRRITEAEIEALAEEEALREVEEEVRGKRKRRR